MKEKEFPPVKYRILSGYYFWTFFWNAFGEGLVNSKWDLFQDENSRVKHCDSSWGMVQFAEYRIGAKSEIWTTTSSFPSPKLPTTKTTAITITKLVTCNKQQHNHHKVWLLACMLLVFLSLVEYAVILRRIVLYRRWWCWWYIIIYNDRKDGLLVWMRMNIPWALFMPNRC